MVRWSQLVLRSRRGSGRGGAPGAPNPGSRSLLDASGGLCVFCMAADTGVTCRRGR